MQITTQPFEQETYLPLFSRPGLKSGPTPSVEASALNPYRFIGTANMKTAQQYCKRLAQARKENFLVTTLCCPREIRQHFFNLYAFARIADDLSDEVEDSRTALSLLAWWRSELEATYRGEPRHPVFVALAETIQRFAVPQALFHDLIDGYAQDHMVSRYETFDDLLAYCRKALGPIGRLILTIGGHTDPESLDLAETCWVAVQLSDIWNDLREDFDKGRCYLPQEDMDRFGVTEEMLATGCSTPELHALMRFQVERTRALFAEGEVLYPLLDSRTRLDMNMYNRCGIAVLDSIAAQGYDVLTRRPSLSKWRKLSILVHRILSSFGKE